jgi:hypothetical protein
VAHKRNIVELFGGPFDGMKVVPNAVTEHIIAWGIGFRRVKKLFYTARNDGRYVFNPTKTQAVSRR